MKLKRSKDIRMNTRMDLTKMTDEEICEEFDFKHIDDFQK